MRPEDLLPTPDRPALFALTVEGSSKCSDTWARQAWEPLGTQVRAVDSILLMATH